MKMQFNTDIWLVRRREFNPEVWINPEKQQRKPQTPQPKSTTRKEHEIEVIVRRIEMYQLDLTLNYQDWLTLGFAFSELGESGRDWFHRVSRFHKDYDPLKCDIQYDQCLKGRRIGITINTFFFMAKSAGINIKV